MRPVKVRAFPCPSCHTLWPTMLGAVDCCSSWVGEVDGWRCSCGLIFTDFDNAESCCQTGDMFVSGEGVA